MDDFETVIRTPEEELEPCPFCGGRVFAQKTAWDWGPFSQRYIKLRCIECGGVYEYTWRSDPWKKVPHAIQWWNTRVPVRQKTHEGYDAEQLRIVAELLKANDIKPENLQQLCSNIEAGVEIAQKAFARDLERKLHDFLAGQKE